MVEGDQDSLDINTKLFMQAPSIDLLARHTHTHTEENEMNTQHFSLQQLPVVTSSVIVRCRSCRTYINPFVNFVDMRRWKCNLCYRVNECEYRLPIPGS